MAGEWLWLAGFPLSFIEIAFEDSSRTNEMIAQQMIYTINVTVVVWVRRGAVTKRHLTYFNFGWTKVNMFLNIKANCRHRLRMTPCLWHLVWSLTKDVTRTWLQCIVTHHTMKHNQRQEDSQLFNKYLSDFRKIRECFYGSSPYLLTCVVEQSITKAYKWDVYQKLIVFDLSHKVWHDNLLHYEHQGLQNLKQLY